MSMRRTWGAGGAVAAVMVAGALAAWGGGREKEPVVAPGTYAGEALCVRCHFRHTRLWKETAHVGAVDKVPARYKDDATCVACHATGAGQQGGYVTIEKTPKLAGVQCEACHGPGADHAALARANEDKLDDVEIERKLKAFFTRDVRVSCVRCHLMDGHKEHPEFEKDAKK